MTGLWLEGRKVAAIGIGCRRWITQHGFALNVDCDLQGFKSVVPCGLINHPVGKLNDWIPGLSIKEVKPLLTQAFQKRFSLNWQGLESIENFEEFIS